MLSLLQLQPRLPNHDIQSGSGFPFRFIFPFFPVSGLSEPRGTVSSAVPFFIPETKSIFDGSRESTLQTAGVRDMAYF